jgi:phosphonate transport system substrate-binding protein
MATGSTTSAAPDPGPGRRVVQCLRLVTWLAPSLPLELFEAIAAAVGDCGLRTTLASVTDLSGPNPGTDPFSAGGADVGFVCAPTYLALRRSGASVELLGVSPVFDDPRASGRPIYFSDVVVSSSSPWRALSDLRGGVLAFNDPSSQSGWHCLEGRLPGGAEARSFFGGVRQSGSHLRSLELVAAGEADVAAIDSNVLRLVARRSPAAAARVRILHSVGPWPIQPVVVRSTLAPSVKARVRRALLCACRSPGRRRALLDFGVAGFARVGESDREWGLLGAPGLAPANTARPERRAIVRGSRS